MAKNQVKDGSVVLGTLRKMVLASVGVVGVAQDEVMHLLDRMVERGEITEKDARKMVSDAQKEFNKRRKSGQTKAERELENLMEKMNVPSKADIEDLAKQVTHLTKRVEELKVQMKK
jgi:poly(hydroxyalkanoate) granule-associated protein